ncbi:MAG TPA: discoidin domain-containing protein [Polyangiaceae bacterium]|nr:discoidin domain-containing protein [Polyangiaceae bacterium]
METQASAGQLSAKEPALTDQPEPAAPVPPRVIPRKRWRRFFGWFWCSSEFAEARAALAKQSDAERRYRTRCKQAMTFARRASEPNFADGGGNPDAVACELYREAVYWALLTLRAHEFDSSVTPAFPELVEEPQARALLGKALAETSPVRELFSRTDFVDISARTPAEQSQALFLMRETAERLQLLVEQPESRLGTLWLRRLVRVSVVFFVLGCLAASVFTLRELREQRADLAHGKNWRASSSAVSGCTSPQQDCDDSPSFFVHTSEEKDPWVEIDLETPTDFSSVRVINRRDSYQERTSPIVIEVSADQTHWKPIARHEGTFRTWKVDVGKQHARYVRVRAVGFKMLHLGAIRILP